MVWREIQPGRYQDELDGAELVFYNMSQALRRFGKEHGSVHAICTISFKNTRTSSTVSLLRDAWKALRFCYPALSVSVDGSTKIYSVPTAQDVEEWADDTFFVNPVHTADEVISQLHLRTLPCLVYLPRSSEVLFHSSHWRVDGIGTCMLLDRFFSIVALCSASLAIPWELERRNLSPSMEDAFGSPKDSSTAMEELAHEMVKRNHINAYPTAALPFKGDERTAPGSPSVEALRLDEASTTLLTTACRTHGISVTAAVHAALAEAVFQAAENDTYDYSTIVAANIRSHLPFPFNDPSHCCTAYLTGFTAKVRRGDSFAARCGSLAQSYKDWYSDLYMQSLRSIYRHHSEALRARAARKDVLPPSGVTLSSLGNIDRYVKGTYSGVIKVESFRLGSAIITRQMTLYPWTYQGRLNLALNYNRAYHEPEAVSNLLTKIIAHLQQELEVELNRDRASASMPSTLSGHTSNALKPQV